MIHSNRVQKRPITDNEAEALLVNDAWVDDDEDELGVVNGSNLTHHGVFVASARTARESPKRRENRLNMTLNLRETCQGQNGMRSFLRAA